MPRPKSLNKVERVVDNPRAMNGNMYAMGAYLEKLRELSKLHREPLVRQILDEMKGNITMSLSTLTMIETGKTKSSGFTTIDAIRRAVGGDPYDISELSRLPIPEDNDEEGIEKSRLEGESRAVARRQQRRSGGGIQIDIRGNDDPNLHEVLMKVANDERLQSVAKQLADDPKALKIVLSFLKAEAEA